MRTKIQSIARVVSARTLGISVSVKIPTTAITSRPTSGRAKWRRTEVVPVGRVKNMPPYWMMPLRIISTTSSPLTGAPKLVIARASSRLNFTRRQPAAIMIADNPSGMLKPWKTAKWTSCSIPPVAAKDAS